MLAHTMAPTERATAAATCASGRAGPGSVTIRRRSPGVIASTAKNISVLRAMPTAPKHTVQTRAQPREVSPLVQIAVKRTAALETSHAEVTTPAPLECACTDSL